MGVHNICFVQITMAITRFEERKEEWDSGHVSDVNGLGEDFNVHQYWTREVCHLFLLRVLFWIDHRPSSGCVSADMVRWVCTRPPFSVQVGFWLGIDWLIQLPLLFAFAARGSLLNTYLGVKYGTMLKWHRYSHSCILSGLPSP
ncbi:MAG: hypothetical protein HC767_10980 [Akkermansiaceae bacterium]|nr:hypothetical protein [Akkermansiaceae bacterium]